MKLLRKICIHRACVYVNVYACVAVCIYVCPLPLMRVESGKKIEIAI